VRDSKFVHRVLGASSAGFRWWGASVQAWLEAPCAGYTNVQVGEDR